MAMDQPTRERPFNSANGYSALTLGIALILLGVFAAVVRLPLTPLPSGLLILGGAFLLSGLYMLQPNQGAIMLLFGEYRGTDRTEGLRWANPFNRKLKMSLRVRNLNSDKIKVNDRRGNPIEIAAAIVWRVDDTARAVFDVDDYEKYVPIQAEAAVRHLASGYAYDSDDDTHQELTLRGGGERMLAALSTELAARFEKAGLVVEEARLTHLAYAPEIAGVMLRRQQAEAIIAARRQIVAGAVSMVEMALAGLAEKKIVELDDERRAAMVSNLLVVLCGETEATPVINTGSLYQ
ncbi:MAG: SPFH domain-containing protein [Gammaproteobacteria bacterium]|nr:SPFH domain-containing protein [Gammaproteobacteria bacterium]